MQRDGILQFLDTHAQDTHAQDEHNFHLVIVDHLFVVGI